NLVQQEGRRVGGRITEDQRHLRSRRQRARNVGTGQSGRRNCAGQIDLWFGLVPEELNIDTVDVVLQTQPAQLGPVLMRRFQRIVEIDWRGIKLGRLSRS